MKIHEYGQWTSSYPGDGKSHWMKGHHVCDEIYIWWTNGVSAETYSQLVLEDNEVIRKQSKRVYPL